MDQISQLLFDDPMTPEEVATYIKVSYRMDRASVAIRDFCPVMDQVEVVWGADSKEWLSLDDACQRVVSAVAEVEDKQFQERGC